MDTNYQDIEKEKNFEVKIEMIKDRKKKLAEKKKELEDLLLILDSPNDDQEISKLSINKLLNKIKESDNIEKKVKYFIKLDSKVNNLETELFK